MTGGQTFVLIMMAIMMLGGAISHWTKVHEGPEALEGRRARRAARIRARRGLDADADPAAERKIQLLSSENERLTGQVSRLEERIAVLERIATDPAERVAREIESLR